jgi:hypothetical protein
MYYLHVDVKSILNITEPQSQPQPQTPQPLPDIATLMVFKIRDNIVDVITKKRLF